MNELKRILDFILSLIEARQGEPVERVVKEKKVAPPIQGKTTLTVTGAYPKYTNMKLHRGVDFGCVKGKKLTSIVKAKVTGVYKGYYKGPKASYVKVRIGGVDIYWKHCKPSVDVGDLIDPGDVLGTCDNSGPWAGYHLHFECRRDNKHIEPLTILNKYQPGLKYKILQGEWNGWELIEIFEKYNKKGLKIIEGK